MSTASVMMINSSVASSQVAAQNALVMQTNTLRFFRSRNALSAKDAIVVTDLDWLEMGMNLVSNAFGNGTERLFKIYGITRTDSGKYWLNPEAFVTNVKRNQERQANAMKWILIIAGIALVFLLLLPFFVINL